MDVIIIVNKCSDSHESWFPFELRVQWQFKVDVHGILDRVTRLVARIDKHEGWRFQIKGNYLPAQAKEALDDVQAAEGAGRIPASVGLRAALKSWMSAKT